MNPEYECATYILNPKINNLVLQKSSSGDFPKKIIQDNPLINKIIDHDQPFLIQQSEYKNEWSVRTINRNNSWTYTLQTCIFKNTAI